MAKKERVKTLQAGSFYYCIQYTPLAGGVKKERRAARQFVSSLVRESINFRTSKEKLWLILVGTFDPEKDLYVSLTYRDADRPKTPELAAKRFKSFLRQLREYRKSKGQETIYVYANEGLHSGGKYHHHLLINSTGDDYAIMRKLWEKNGTQVEILPYNCKSHWSHAEYLTKEPGANGRRHVGDRMWKASRNVKRPVITYEDVPADSELVPPPGAYVEHRASEQNSYGRFQYLECRLEKTATE